MPQTSSVLEQLTADFPDIHFIPSDDFQWSPDTRTITHPPIQTDDDRANLLHEVGHAQLEHASYRRDITLLDMERQAWRYAQSTLAPRYGLELSMNDKVVDDALDSYRQWLHARSTCPHCQAIGVEQTTATYLCLICHSIWTVNEARTCQLRRYKQ